MEKFDLIKLENQLCFPLYAASKEMIKKYREFLDPMDLTYTQYLAMMVMWEKQSLSSKELGEYIHLDSGTFTPVLKKLQSKGYVTKERDTNDERNLIIRITTAGNELREIAKDIPEKMFHKTNLTNDEINTLYLLLYKMLD